MAGYGAAMPVVRGCYAGGMHAAAMRPLCRCMPGLVYAWWSPPSGPPEPQAVSERAEAREVYGRRWQPFEKETAQHKSGRDRLAQRH